MRPRPPIPSLFPYTTLFRSTAACTQGLERRRIGYLGVIDARKTFSKQALGQAVYGFGDRRPLCDGCSRVTHQSRQRSCALTIIGREVAVAARHREAVGFPNDRNTEDALGRGL